MADLFESVQLLTSELTEKITGLVGELVREGIRDRLRTILEGDFLEGRAAAPAKSKKAKRAVKAPRAAKSIAKPRGGSQPCGVCHKPGHNRRTCPERDNVPAGAGDAMRELKPEKVIPPIATKPVVVAKPPRPTAETKRDRFARIQAAADRRNGVE